MIYILFFAVMGMVFYMMNLCLFYIKRSEYTEKEKGELVFFNKETEQILVKFRVGTADYGCNNILIYSKIGASSKGAFLRQLNSSNEDICVFFNKKDPLKSVLVEPSAQVAVALWIKFSICGLAVIYSMWSTL